MVQDSGFGVEILKVQGSGFRDGVCGFGVLDFRVQGLGLKV